MSRQTNTHRRLHLPAITRRQLRTRTHDLQDLLRHTSQEAQRQQQTAEQHLAGADQLIAGLRLTVEELEGQIKQQAADAVDAGVLQQQLDAALAANEELVADYLAVKAELENVTAITVPPVRRDIDGLEQPTEPIYVRTWREYMERVGTAGQTLTVKPLADAFGGAR